MSAQTPTHAERNADIIRMAQRLEQRLADRGALGRGLGEYARSLRGTLPDDVLHDIMKVNRVRNDLVHRNIDLPLTSKERASVQASYERALEYLGRGEVNARPAQRVNLWAVAGAALLVVLIALLALMQGPA
ncbi:hypothetical protein GCM10017783_15360 [Deinococcus piscis]|uniref:DUF4145 domain-containing protein n=1 Tax=Deinococcus piscis TaxID=394230 RepID=A0ABQ3K8K7_9DEIO|nr:hypothetical protein [Deinococcus piscis]GHG03694.1 hypothetical protein GCM10017783_15360 [Deinococcus piscis]